ncbi:conserved hypothetical protein [Ricinus communis]|uniref:Uncharacterized protein n=1 Tax=Ricinus communis TaxID=3988 RepID=B9T7F4_RICCO|nr:conserved hypothetical protein [Ricinus communis]
MTQLFEAAASLVSAMACLQLRAMLYPPGSQWIRSRSTHGAPRLLAMRSASQLFPEPEFPITIVLVSDDCPFLAAPCLTDRRRTLTDGRRSAEGIRPAGRTFNAVHLYSFRNQLPLATHGARRELSDTAKATHCRLRQSSPRDSTNCSRDDDDQVGPERRARCADPTGSFVRVTLQTIFFAIREHSRCDARKCGVKDLTYALQIPQGADFPNFVQAFRVAACRFNDDDVNTHCRSFLHESASDSNFRGDCRRFVHECRRTVRGRMRPIGFFVAVLPGNKPRARFTLSPPFLSASMIRSPWSPYT